MGLTTHTVPLISPRVVCAGVLVADHLSTPIDHAPAAGELVAADELVLNIGGCACNAAMAMARLGVQATICGKVGDDVFGRFVADNLELRFTSRGQTVLCHAAAVIALLAVAGWLGGLVALGAIAAPVVFSIFRMAAVAVRPSISGICTSINTTSKDCF